MRSPLTPPLPSLPHALCPSGVYWGLYLTARNYENVPTAHPAEFYLNASVNTILAVNCHDPAADRENCLVTVGLMDGTVFRELLRALKAEGPAWSAQAELIEGIQRKRVLGDPSNGWEGWNSMDAPFGSEFSWDTTGQEEVAVWGAYFNASDAGWMHGNLADRTVDAILYVTEALGAGRRGSCLLPRPCCTRSPPYPEFLLGLVAAYCSRAPPPPTPISRAGAI